jgi:hypothetical protein
LTDETYADPVSTHTINLYTTSVKRPVSITLAPCFYQGLKEGESGSEPLNLIDVGSMTNSHQVDARLLAFVLNSLRKAET